jgi:glycosyltransferase involved in cell wall biosynthesis
VENKIQNLSIVIPSKNDELLLIQHLETVLKFCERNIINYEILIVVNGSIEKNITLLDETISELNNSSINIINSEIVGKGIAIKTGIQKSKFDNILITDADFSVDINHLTDFVDELGQPLGPFVVGSRKSKQSSVINTPLTRRITGFFYTLLVKMLLKITVDDTQCGFKLINKNTFYNSTDFINTGFSYDVELFLLAKSIDIRPIEIPVIYIHENKSNINVVKDSIRMFTDLVTIYRKYYSLSQRS